MWPLKIRFNQILAIFQLVVGIFILLTALITGDGLQLIMGCFFIILGILYLTNPALVITAKEVVVKNPFGLTMKRYPYTMGDLKIEGNKILLANKKIFVAASFVIHSPDFKKLKKLLATNLEDHLVE